MLKGRKVGQPFWQSFLKFLSFEFAYSQCLEGSEHQCWVSFSLFISTIPTSFSVVPGEQRFVMDSGNALIFETSRYLKCLSLQIESGKMEQYAKHFFNFGDDK
uniref:Uncharacterized protein n=1 Tax=Salix viminalis TaxID=40686 RepID=A0A6N2KHJ3_SALVM